MQLRQYILASVVGMGLALSPVTSWSDTKESSGVKTLDQALTKSFDAEVESNRVYCYRASADIPFPICCASMNQHRCFTEPTLSGMVDLWIREKLSSTQTDLIERQMYLMERVNSLLERGNE